MRALVRRAGFRAQSSRRCAWARDARGAAPRTHRCCRGRPRPSGPTAPPSARSSCQRRLPPASRRRTHCRAARGRAASIIGSLVERVARDQLHVAEAARIVERDDRAVRHVEHHMIVRRELAARVMEFARRRPRRCRAARGTSPTCRDASAAPRRRRCPRAGIWRAGPSRSTVCALEPLVEVLRKRKAQVRPALLDPHEARALHHGLQAAAHGLDFGKLGHGQFSTRNESNTRVTSGSSASSAR